MSYSGGKITAPVEIWDPYTALGVGRPSTGYNLGVLISNHYSLINKWAKFKPVWYYHELFVSDPTNPSYNPNWWKAKYPPGDGHDGDCGLLLPNAVSDQTSWNQCANESFKVGYRYPVGRTSNDPIYSPFRQTDWAGYNHKAKCPVRVEMPKEMVVSNVESFLQISLKFSSPSPDTLSLTDIKPDAATDMADMYLTVAIVGSGNTRFFQPSLPVSSGSDMDDSVLKLSLNCGTQSTELNTIYTDLGFAIAHNSTVKIYAMLGAMLPNSVTLDGGRGRRSVSPPSPWSTLYYEDKPYAELALTARRVTQEITATITSATVIMTTETFDSDKYGYLDLQQLVYRLQYSPVTPVEVYPVINVYYEQNNVREYLMENVEVYESKNTVNTNNTSHTHAVQGFPQYRRRFMLNNSEAAYYSKTYTLEIGLRTTATNMIIKGVRTGTLTLNQATGLWSVSI